MNRSINLEEQPVADAEHRLSLDVVFEVLKNTRRRWVLQYLHEHDGGTTLGELAEHIAAIENEKPRSQLDSQERKRVYVGLYQCHLPKMDDADVIEFDDDRGTVELGPNAPQVYTYLSTATENDDATAWPRYYLGYAVAGGAVALTALLAVPSPFETVLVTLVLVGLIGVAGLHTRVEADDE